MLQTFSQTLLIDMEKIPDKGEDSYVLRQNEECGLFGVFDGCGGSGSRKYPEFGGYTGAYIGSRLVSNILASWFDEKSQAGMENLDASSIPGEWTALIEEAHARVRSNADNSGALAGSMVKEFPTTLAACLIRGGKSGDLRTDVFWCGDSRMYTLDESGLHQLTVDDLKNSDPMENLRNDAAQTNVISGSGPFQIHHSAISLRDPVIIFGATDGAFGFVPTPMHFEMLLLDSLISSESVADWQRDLSEFLSRIAGDDVTVCGALYGFHSFEDVKELYRQRRETVAERYIVPLDPYREGLACQLWSDYRTDYERYPDNEGK